MTYRQLTLILTLFIIASFSVIAQNTLSEKAFIKSLINEEYSTPADARELNLSELPYSVTVDEEGDPYTVYFSIIAHEDLNEDGIDDYIVFRNSEGMLGGNVHSNQQYLFFIMKDDKEVNKTFEILGYAPFSYNIIGETSYKNKRLTAEITQNFRSYMAEDLQSTTAHFVYKDNNLYEESYLSNCEMAKMKDKSIFKTDLPNIKRSLDIDMDNYTEIAAEEYIQGDTIINASLSGCDNLSLRFDISIKVPEKKFTLNFYKQTTLEVFDILIAQTRYKTILNKALADYRKQSYQSNDRISANIDNGWSYLVSKFNYNNDKNYLSFSILIDNTINQNQDENWEITTRRK